MEQRFLHQLEDLRNHVTFKTIQHFDITPLMVFSWLCIYNLEHCVIPNSYVVHCNTNVILNTISNVVQSTLFRSVI